MYKTIEVATRIKETAKRNGIKISEMLSACGLNINTLSSMINRGSWIQANSLAIIADYLRVSVDYLLGRTENISIEQPENEFYSDDNIIKNMKISINGIEYKIVPIKKI
ncbi:MAG: helix-turn-helix domain-containing protein [Ruminococcus flavefaciens]|nr:helix-turn-helix domain-containing protein [Ruminococcus flavefaciens]